MKYDDAPQIVKNYLAYKGTTQGRSDLTVFQYYHDLRTFFRFILKEKYKDRYEKTDVTEINFSDCTDEDIISVTTDDIYNFLIYTNDSLENKSAARARKLCTIRGFYKYLVSRYIIEENPAEKIDSPKQPRRLPKYLTLEESEKLLSSIGGKNFHRDYAIITIFLNCGVRVSELANISLADIDKDITKLTVIGKGNKERIVYLNNACHDAITEYLKVRPSDTKRESRNALFVSRNRNRLNVKTIQWLVYKYLKAAGLEYKHLSVHKLRHTAATLMYQSGKTDIRVLKDILGHESLSTTQIYTHVADEQMKKALDSNPLSEIKVPKITFPSDDASEKNDKT